MGEPLGDGATRMEVGGKIIYGGGGGSPPPQPTTKITESAPTFSSSSSATEIPRYLTNASQDLVARGQALTSQPYKAYKGARVAEFSPDMQTAFQRMREQEIAPQLGEATGLASLAGQRASDYGMFQEGVQQYMNPYMQNVVDVERRKAQENADRQSAMLSGQAAKQGAFGGSGAALQQRALTRDTAQQLADIQTLGSGRAYEQAAGQYNTGISNMLGASGQLGGLGQQQFGQEMDVTQGLGLSGDIQRQREQALLDVKYNDYLAKQRYAYEQLAFQQGLIAGVPYSTTQRSSSVSQPGKSVSQAITANPSNMAAGGVVGRYAEGGITSLLSDQQIDQRQQMPNISDLARMSLQAEEMERAQLRAAQQGIMAQRPQGTVADEEMARIAAMEQGIGGLDVPDDLVGDEYTAAGGGIVAFNTGNAVPPLGDEIIRRARTKQRNGMALTEDETLALQNADRIEPPIAPELGGIAGMAREMSKFRAPGPQLGGISDQPPIELPKEEEEEERDKIPQMSMGVLDRAYQPVIDLIRQSNEKEVAAQKAYMDDLGKEEKATSDFAAKARQRIQDQLAGLEGADSSALESSVLDFGLRLLGSKGEANRAKAIASAGLNTIAGHKEALKDIAAKRDRYNDALAKVEEFEYDENKGSRKQRRDAILNLGKAEAGLAKELAPIFGNRATSMIQLHRDNFSAQRESSRAKSGAGSGSMDRMSLQALTSARVGLQAQLNKAKNSFEESDVAAVPVIEAQLNSVINELTRRGGLGGTTPGSSGTVTGSSTLPAGFKLD
jgi:hypothetical protein